jgi:hypothetical protein
MDEIQLSGKAYPFRFDMRALKEYKAKTKNDILIGFDQSTENVIALTFCAIKSGLKFRGEDFSKLTEDDIADIVTVADLKLITSALISQVGGGGDDQGEAKPS